jgi:hypothetical protein
MHEHTGTASVVRLADGSRILRLEGLDTSDGPDLEVWLSDAPVPEGQAGWHVFDDGRFRSPGRLRPTTDPATRTTEVLQVLGRVEGDAAVDQALGVRDPG